MNIYECRERATMFAVEALDVNKWITQTSWKFKFVQHEQATLGAHPPASNAPLSIVFSPCGTNALFPLSTNKAHLLLHET